MEDVREEIRKGYIREKKRNKERVTPYKWILEN
jgi:hypothetical protein